MQTPRSSRPGNVEVAQKAPRTRKLKSPGSTPNAATKTPKDPTPKVVADRKSPRIPATEKKRPSKVSELEPQIAELQEELKKAKEQLTSSEWRKKRAQQEAEEAKKQLAAMSAKLNELYESDEARIQELRKISQDRDRAWQSELDSVQKHYSMESAALASAMHEIQKLKRVSQSEASREAELHLKESNGELRAKLQDLQSSLLEKEARLQGIRDENEELKRQIINTETEQNEAAELTESCKKVERVTEQLDAAQASNAELETELRRLKVQCDQWRKAAEAAAAMVLNVERTGSWDDDTDDDSPKKKSGNMLKKIGVLLKKGPK